MAISLAPLDFTFSFKPLLFGGGAMEHYGLRKTGADIDLLVSRQDHEKLENKFPGNVKDLYGDRGICIHGFEIWNQVCTFDYDRLRRGAIELDSHLVISLEELLFMKALAMRIPKFHDDLKLIVELVLKKAYGKA